MSKILLVLNQDKLGEDFATILKLEGHEVFSVKDDSEARRLLIKDVPDLAIIDTSKGDLLLKDLLKNFPNLPVICWLLERNSHMAVELIQNGAIDCLCPPLRAAEVIGVTNHILGRPHNLKLGTKFILPYFSLWQYRKFAKIIAGVLALIFIARVVLFNTSTQVLDLPHKNPTSIALSKDNIWIGDWYTQSIYSYKLDKKLKLVENFYFSNFGPLAITIDKKFLWSCGNDLVLRKHIIDDKLEVINNYKLEEHSPSGIAVIGDYLWVSDSSERRITKYILAQSLTFINSYDCTLSIPVGLAWDGKNIWLADAKDNKVYVYQETSKVLLNKKIYKLPSAVGQLASIYPDGKWLYAVYAGNPGRLYKYKISSLKEEKIKPNK